MKVVYFDLMKQVLVDGEVANVADLRDLHRELVENPAEGYEGHPTLELQNEAGASLSLSFADTRALVVWTKEDRKSFSSYLDRFESDFVFFYMGSWSEASAENVVPLEDAFRSAAHFIDSGDPRYTSFNFLPD